MSFRRIYLDTNTINRAFEGNAADELAQDIVGMLGMIKLNQPARFVTSQITLAEVLVHPIRTGDDYRRTYYQQLLSRSTPWLRVPHVSQSILVAAAELRATMRFKLPDAIHIATALSEGCSHILTSDRDFAVVSSGSPLPVSIRPTRETIDAIIDWLRK